MKIAYCYRHCITHFCFDCPQYSIVRRISPQPELSPDIIKISNLSIELLIFTSTLQHHLCVQFIWSLIIWTILLVLKADGNLSNLECVSTPLASKKHKHILVFEILLSIFALLFSFHAFHDEFLFLFLGRDAIESNMRWRGIRSGWLVTLNGWCMWYYVFSYELFWS